MAMSDTGDRTNTTSTRQTGGVQNERDALHDISEQMEGDFVVDPLLKYFDPRSSSPLFSVADAIAALKCQGYYHIPSVLTREECNEALKSLWNFVEDVSGGCVVRNDPLSWYPPHEVIIVNEDGQVKSHPGKITVKEDDKLDESTNCNHDYMAHPIISTDPNEHDDLDPWPHTGYHSFPDMFQTLGAGYVLGDVRENLAQRVFEPLFGSRELLSSKEGFTFCRPLIVDFKSEDKHQHSQNEVDCKTIVWKPHYLNSIDHATTTNMEEDHGGDVQKQRPLYKVCGKPQPISEGQHFDQGVPISVATLHSFPEATSEKVSKKQQNRNRKKLEKRQKLKDLVGLCHIQASISFTDQTLDQHRGGGHFLCYPHSHSDVHWKLVGGTYRATPSEKSERDDDPTWVPLTDQEILKLADMGCYEKRIYANVGDVILWRSDLVHAGVAPSLQIHSKNDNGRLKYSGSKEFRAVGYCSMLPAQAVKEYLLYSLEKQKVVPSRGKMLSQATAKNALLHDSRAAQQLIDAIEDKLFQQKLESYKTGRTGDHRPDREQWHQHRRITMWNKQERKYCFDSQQSHCKLIPPRLLQRPRFRLGKPTLTLRLAELYGLIQYRQPSHDEETRLKDIERAVIRGVRFIEGVYRGRHVNGEEMGSWKVSDGKYCMGVGCSANAQTPHDTIPICLATLDMLKPQSEDSSSGKLNGQDKYLGGMASPCGRYVYGVPGHAKRVVRVDTRSGAVDMIGPEYTGEFKWLRGVEVPMKAMGTAYPSGCCLALPCNSENGCVLKIDPETSEVTTFLTGQPISNVDEGWLYHGGNLASDNFVYAIPASAPRVMKIDPRAETTEYIGPEYHGKAKWYGGITGIDGCIYGIPHNATGVLKIDPSTQEVTILAENTLPKGRWKWHGGLASKDRSKIIGFPNSEDSLLVIDVVNQNVRTVGDSSSLRSGYHRVPQDSGYKYLGGSITSDGKFAYLFPCDAEYVLRFDMETEELRLVGPQLTEGENKFQNGFLGKDDCIYGVPQRSSGILRIIPPGVDRYGRNGFALSAKEEYIDVIYVGDELVSCKDKFEGGVLGLDGKIYCIPLRAKVFVVVLPGKSA